MIQKEGQGKRIKILFLISKEWDNLTWNYFLSDLLHSSKQQNELQQIIYFANLIHFFIHEKRDSLI